MDAPQAPAWTPIRAQRSRQTLRERWLAAMTFRKPDRLPLMEFGYWAETLPAWHDQGLPRTIQTEADAYAYFGIEDWLKAGVSTGIYPSFEQEVLETGPDYTIVRDGDRAIRKERREGIRTIPHYLEYGLKNREDWKLFKARLDPATPGRYPADWAQRVEAYRTREAPLSISIGSMLGTPRNWIGFENVGLLAYDDPELLDEIVESCCVCVCETIKPALEQVQFDFGAGWEDVCFKNGPIISPKMFERFVVPRYKRITDLLHAHGVKIIWTDCDGNILPILDQFLDGGINCMFPLEVAGGSDPVAIRQKYGRRVLLHGGVDKMPLRAGPKEIEREMLRLKPLVEEGGFIPHVDHRCPADVPLANYKFYLKLKREMFNAGDLTPHYKE